MPRKIGLLFSGQGAQQVGMGKDLAGRYAVAANLFAEADRQLGRPLTQLAFDGPMEDLTKTRNSHVALYVHGLAVLQVIEEESGPISAVAAARRFFGEFTLLTVGQLFAFSARDIVGVHRIRFLGPACNLKCRALAAGVGGAGK